jgi:hypothetical protein
VGFPFTHNSQINLWEGGGFLSSGVGGGRGFLWFNHLSLYTVTVSVAVSLRWALRVFGYLLLQYGEKIFSDEEVFEQIKPKSRKAYEKCWKEFKKLNPEINFEEGPPGEEAIVNFFRHLRLEKNVASFSIWTLYSYINSILKQKYGFKLQELPRVMLFIKGLEVDTKKKVAWGV